jgi:hypothetical protein
VSKEFNQGGEREAHRLDHGDRVPAGPNRSDAGTNSIGRAEVQSNAGSDDVLDLGIAAALDTVARARLELEWNLSDELGGF